MNQSQSRSAANRGCHTRNTVGRVANTPMSDHSPTVSSIQQSHELTAEEEGEVSLWESQKHAALCFPRRLPGGETERLYSCEPGCIHYVTTALLRATAPKHWNRTAPRRAQEPVSKGGSTDGTRARTQASSKRRRLHYASTFYHHTQHDHQRSSLGLCNKIRKDLCAWTFV